MTYEEFIALAQENYNKGGDVVVECWGKTEFDFHIREFGAMTKTKALQTFRLYKAEQREQAAMARWERREASLPVMQGKSDAE